MQRIAVAAQRADGDAVVRQLLLELDQLAVVVEHRELAVRIAGIVAGAQFHRIHPQTLQFFDHPIQRQAGEQCGEDSDFHDLSPLGQADD